MFCCILPRRDRGLRSTRSACPVLTPITPLLRLGLRALLGWLDERTQAPIMRQYINDGSRRYFHREQSERGASEFDELLAEPAWAELSNPRHEDASANMTTSRAPSASWLRVVGYVVLGALATLYSTLPWSLR